MTLTLAERNAIFQEVRTMDEQSTADFVRLRAIIVELQLHIPQIKLDAEHLERFNKIAPLTDDFIRCVFNAGWLLGTICRVWEGDAK